jgi:hypothetical protein
VLGKVGSGKNIDTFMSDVQINLEERSDMSGLSTTEKLPTEVVVPGQKIDASL